MTTHRTLLLLTSAIAAVSLVACGGGQSTIGGTVTGLTNGLSVVLQNNGADNLTVTGTSASSIGFTFTTEVLANKTYSATVLTQPSGETCTVGSGSGTIAATAVDITSITVTCAITSTVVGIVSGVASGGSVSLSSNGNTLVAGNGTFAFPGILTTGATYSVTITKQPTGQSCALSNAIGTVVSGVSSVVRVTCT